MVVLPPGDVGPLLTDETDDVVVDTDGRGAELVETAVDLEAVDDEDDWRPCTSGPDGRCGCGLLEPAEAVLPFRERE